MMTDTAFRNFELYNDFGPLCFTVPFLPFGPVPVSGSRFHIESAELHDPAIAFCTLRYTLRGGSEQTSRWEPLKGTFDAPIFKMSDGAALETKIIREGSRTIVELTQNGAKTVDVVGYPSRCAEWAMNRERFLMNIADASDPGDIPPPPNIPLLTSFTVDVTFRD